MTPTVIQIAPKPYRPDLRWVEDVLGESLQTPSKPPGYGQPNAQLDAAQIPLGEYCYDHLALQNDDYRPCAYFQRTDYGTVKCLFLGIEVINDDLAPIIQHFGSQANMDAANLIDTWSLPDSIKECGISMLFPTTLVNLQSAVDDYEQAVLGKRVNLWTKPYPERATHEESKLRTIALDRLFVWECLCSMVEDVPAPLIFRLQLADAMHRGHTQPSSALIDSNYAGELAHHPEPERQFWYMYRTHFYDISMHWNDVCWLANRAQIAALYYYDQRVAAIIALREASEKTV
jgi:hypothetical protein